MIMKLDFASSVPIYQQVRDQIVQAIADEIFKDGDRLPTVRALAQETGINTMTVNKAYQLLKQEGYIITDRRNGAMVCSQKKMENGISEELKESFRLIIAEAKIAGVKEEELLTLCQKLYRREKL
ncbi:GntR family transcriptional regulator [Roseburia sp. MSJ-14]|uniref:GntR family transcriptional regulator n=1 Tax=Roseburia sp. MSJ-14 TaxID=2841514 RepID=UPI001C111391|nr:GntR family transcriptional regulator [Roseburia sp. MSJ-14]MBU5473702.1 GntR family transcriptional regulator [Roseburia sp. MSJ-14]